MRAAWRRDLLEEPKVEKPLKNFPKFCGSRSFIGVFVRAAKLVRIRSQMNPVHITATYFSKIYDI
jgi:hypothetical protein